MKPSWNDLIVHLPGAHLLQTMEWGKVKEPVGWRAHQIIWRANPDERKKNYLMQRVAGEQSNPIFDGDETPAAAAMMLIRQFSIWGSPTPFKLAYTPKGPLLNWENERLRAQVLLDLTQFAKQAGALLLKIDPDVRLGLGIPGTPEAVQDQVGEAILEELEAKGWNFSQDQVQFRNTVTLNLEADEEALLKRMKQKTRYNIRLAARKGVKVRRGDLADIGLLYRLYAETSLRDGFVIRNEGYYRNLWTTFMGNVENQGNNDPIAEPLIAEVAGEAIAAVIIFRFANKAWFLFGMSGKAHRNLMPNYLLQWEAIRYAKSTGCTLYDMWGAPDHFDEQDSLSGVFRFKRGFQGEVIRTLGAWDIPLRPIQYRLYTRLLPAILDRMRKRGKSRTQQLVPPL